VANRSRFVRRARPARARCALACLFACFAPIGTSRQQAAAEPQHTRRQVAPRVDAKRRAAKVVELTNAERKRRGIGPLKLNDRLAEMAAWMARDQSAQKALSHTDSRGEGLPERARRFGYTGYQYLGENIARSTVSPERVVAQWMGSPGHRANILNPHFTEIGVGYASRTGKAWEHYWVQDLGAPFASQ
jgi:uncharacterized protein YkwD